MKPRDKQIKQSKYDTREKYKLNDDDNNDGGGGGSMRVEQAIDLRNKLRKSQTHRGGSIICIRSQAGWKIIRRSSLLHVSHPNMCCECVYG